MGATAAWRSVSHLPIVRRMAPCLFLRLAVGDGGSLIVRRFHRGDHSRGRAGGAAVSGCIRLEAVAARLPRPGIPGEAGGAWIGAGPLKCWMAFQTCSVATFRFVNFATGLTAR